MVRVRAKRDFCCSNVRVSVKLHGQKHLSKLDKAGTRLDAAHRQFLPQLRRPHDATPHPTIKHATNHRYETSVKKRIYLTTQRLCKRTPAGPLPQLWAPTNMRHGAGIYVKNSSYGSVSLQVHPPCGTPPRHWVHWLTTSDRRTSSWAV